MAVLLLKEMLSSANWFGIACALVGVIIIEKSWSKGRIKQEKASRNFAFPIMATLSVALSQVVRKSGLVIYDVPLVGLVVGYACSLLIYTSALLHSHISRQVFSLHK